MKENKMENVNIRVHSEIEFDILNHDTNKRQMIENISSTALNFSQKWQVVNENKIQPKRWSMGKNRFLS